MEFYGLFKEFQKKGLGLTKIGSDDVFGEDSSDEELVSPLSKEFKPIWETSHQKYRSDESASSIRKKISSKIRSSSESTTNGFDFFYKTNHVETRGFLINNFFDYLIVIF